MLNLTLYAYVDGRNQTFDDKMDIVPIGISAERRTRIMLRSFRRWVKEPCRPSVLSKAFLEDSL